MLIIGSPNFQTYPWFLNDATICIAQEIIEETLLEGEGFIAAERFPGFIDCFGSAAEA
jgi:hypothetical protein